MRNVITIVVAAPLAALAAAAQTPPPAAPAGGSIFDKAVNRPGIGWEIYGPNQSAKEVPAPELPSKAAVRVQIGRAGTHPWDAGANYSTVKPVPSGDTMLVMVYLRAPDAKEGAGPMIPIGAGETDAPYAQIAGETVQVGPAWKRYFASGTTASALAAGKARIFVQLAGGKQVVELGPAFLLDLGPGFDRAKLPHN